MNANYMLWDRKIIAFQFFFLCMRTFGVNVVIRTCEGFLCIVAVVFLMSIVLTSLFTLFYVTRV